MTVIEAGRKQGLLGMQTWRLPPGLQCNLTPVTKGWAELARTQRQLADLSRNTTQPSFPYPPSRAQATAGIQLRVPCNVKVGSPLSWG